MLCNCYYFILSLIDLCFKGYRVHQLSQVQPRSTAFIIYTVSTLFFRFMQMNSVIWLPTCFAWQLYPLVHVKYLAFLARWLLFIEVRTRFEPGVKSSTYSLVFSVVSLRSKPLSVHFWDSVQPLSRESGTGGDALTGATAKHTLELSEWAFLVTEDFWALMTSSWQNKAAQFEK